MADWVFEVQDRDGRIVRLARDRWAMHIIEKHSEVEPHLAEICQVIQSPAISTQDALGSFHHSTLGAVKGKDRLYLEVVVRYDETVNPTVGDVLTIHFNGRPPKGELKWIKMS